MCLTNIIRIVLLPPHTTTSFRIFLAHLKFVETRNLIYTLWIKLFVLTWTFTCVVLLGLPVRRRSVLDLLAQTICPTFLPRSFCPTLLSCFWLFCPAFRSHLYKMEKVAEKYKFRGNSITPPITPPILTNSALYPWSSILWVFINCRLYESVRVCIFLSSQL